MRDDWSTLKKLIWLYFLQGGGSSAVTLTATGISPLALVNAVAHSILSLTQYGKCEQRNLPQGYTELSYIESDGTQYIDTGYTFTSDFVEVGVKWSGFTGTGTKSLCGAYSGVLLNATASNGVSAMCSTVSCFSGSYDPTAWNTMIFNLNNPYERLGVVSLNGVDANIEVVNAPSRDYPYFLFANNRSGSVRSPIATKISHFYLKDNGVLVRNFVPARRNSDNAVGMYDTVGGVFYLSAAENTAFVAGADAVPTPSNSMPIWCNNGEIKYSANIANVNSTTASVGYYIASNGTVTADTNNWFYQAYIPVQPNTTYTLSFDTSVYYVTISEYATAEDSGFVVRKNGATGGNISLTITTEATTNYIRFGTNINRNVVTMDAVLAIKWMLAKSATAVPYAPYVALNGGLYVDGAPEALTITDADSNTQTASVVSLFAVGDAADSQEIVGGDVDRIITKFRVTSDMGWLLASGTGYKQFYTAATQGVLANSKSCMSNIAPYGCTASNRASYSYGCYTGGTGNLCFQMQGATEIETVDDWKAFLDANIVYVVAELANATAESVTPHSLHSYAGTTIVTAATNVDPVTLSVEYKGIAS